ncbi:MAG: GTP-binding protein [bacterium]|nr:GTP-binding protein [bacterium]
MVKKNDKISTNQANFFPPVVAVLGHVDHGKTTLLDTIRKTSVAQREYGGITQKIGASSIETTHDGIKRRITFIDTPGHEAFSAMRSRGTQAADIGLLIVSIADGVMPQTIESIKLLQACQTPFIVVLTKMDLPGLNIAKIKGQLTKEGMMFEGMGGDVPIVEVSAKTEKGIKELLDLILLVFDVQNSKPIQSDSKDAEKPDPKSSLKAIVIESKLDQKVGPKATVVVKDGTLNVREKVVSDNVLGKVKTIIDDKGVHLEKATIGDAVEILGFESVPAVGSIVQKKGEMNTLVSPRQPDDSSSLAAGPASQNSESVQSPSASQNSIDLSTPATPFVYAEEPTLSIIIVADTEGSLEAIDAMVPKGVFVVAKKTGDITSSDVLLAKSSKAIIVGFNSKIRPDALILSRTEKVLVKNYNIIYELIDEIKDVVEGRKQALIEEVLGEAKILASFPFEKTKVLGIKVLQGRIAKGDKVRLLRGDQKVGESNIASLRQGKESISKIRKGEEGGAILFPFLDFTIGDMLISLS